MSDEKMRTEVAIIAGGGPAGLTAAYELAGNSSVKPVVFEKSDILGGISRTMLYHGNRIDIGGHRFFTKNRRVGKLWEELLPLQSGPAKDEVGFIPSASSSGTADPEIEDRVFLRRRRVSRIYYLRSFFDYPVKASFGTFRNLGLLRTMNAGFGYLWALILKRKEKSLEDFYINRFGKPLYNMFFEKYTEKVWGTHPSKLGADWGAQRVKGLSIATLLKNLLVRNFSKNSDKAKVETSLIEEFLYPKYGPGQLWETLASEAKGKGAEVVMNTAVKKIIVEGNRIKEVVVENRKGESNHVSCDYFISSIPLKELVASLEGIEIPERIRYIAEHLPYRDFITVGLLVDKLKIRNSTKLYSYDNRVPDTWIYIQEQEVKLGRLQIFNNWSPYLVEDFENKMWIGLEYFCSEGDDMWNMSDSEFISLATKELESIGIIDSHDVEDAVRIKVRKAYPAYMGSYDQLDHVKEFLNGIENLYCIGRNGQHRYNNMDHSMLTALEAADAIISQSSDKTRIWNVNTEKEYHESK